jgi:hypothetical protein
VGARGNAQAQGSLSFTGMGSEVVRIGALVWGASRARGYASSLEIPKDFQMLSTNDGDDALLG